MPEQREDQLEQPIEEIRPDDTMIGHVAKHDSMLSNTVQIGKVVAPDEGDPARPATGAFVLVHVGGEEPKTYTRNWMPWLTRRAGLDAEWWKPDLDEQVLVLAPSGNLAIGVVAGSIYRGTRLYFPPDADLTTAAASGSAELLPVECSAHTETDLSKHTAQSAEHIHKQVYRDGTTMEYDSVLHTMTHRMKREHAEKNPSISLNTLLEEKKGTVVLSLREPTAEQAILSLSAMLEEKNGNVTLALGDKTSLIAALKDDKGSVDITIDKTRIQVTDELITITDPNGSILEMNDSGITLTSSKIVLKGGSTTVTVDDNGAEVA